MVWLVLVKMAACLENLEISVTKLVMNIVSLIGTRIPRNVSIKSLKWKKKNGFFLNLIGFFIMDRYVYLIFNRTTSENNINTSNNDSFIIWIISDEQLWSGVIKSIIKHFGLHRRWLPPSVFNYPILFKEWVFFYK